jgi:hypothetical protein
LQSGSGNLVLAPHCARSRFLPRMPIKAQPLSCLQAAPRLGLTGWTYRVAYDRLWELFATLDTAPMHETEQGTEQPVFRHAGSEGAAAPLTPGHRIGPSARTRRPAADRRARMDRVSPHPVSDLGSDHTSSTAIGRTALLPHGACSACAYSV